MVMFYFSGTGNSKCVAELFAEEMTAACHSIEEDINFETLIEANETIGFCYPVYMSRVPRIMREFVKNHMDKLKDKKVVIFCTQWLFSGDGARSFFTLFPKNHVEVIYAEHFLMPNNVNNVFILPIPDEKTIEKSVTRAKRKMQNVCNNIKNGKVKKRGFNIFSQILGLFQGLLLYSVENKANNSLKISDNCTNCHICVNVCPMSNLVSENQHITHKHNCTMCYRCINKCPKHAINVVYHGKVKGLYKGM